MKTPIDEGKKEKSQKKEIEKNEDDMEYSRKYELNPINKFNMNMLIENLRTRSKLY